MPDGFLTLLLHAHMPYVRQAGRRLDGEEVLHEAIAEAYVPLLNVLYDLRAAGVPFRLTLGMSPILVEQLADVDVLDRFERHLLESLRRAEEGAESFQKEGGDPQAGHLLYLSRFYADWYGNLHRSFRDRFARDLVGAFRLLQDEGWVEIIASAATHAYLPLLERDSSIYAQLKTGVTSYLRHFGRLPRGVWLPECGYRPSWRQTVGDVEVVRPGLEEFLAELNLRYTFADLPSGGVGQVGRSQGAAAGRAPLRPHYLQSSNVAVFIRDAHTGKQVWSAVEGYPGDYVYREAGRRDERFGLHCWRITGDGVASEQKELYDPYHAFHRAREHAGHFVEVVREDLDRYNGRSGRRGIIVAAYPAELLGRWWFEGIPWIKEVLRLLGGDPGIALVTAGEYLEMCPPEEPLPLEDLWGQGESVSTSSSRHTERMGPLMQGVDRRMEGLVAQFPDAAGDRLEILKQAARELLLLQAGDWPFEANAGPAAEYARARFQEHLDCFDRLAQLAEKRSLNEQDRAFLQECRHLDNPFLNMDYRVFVSREEPLG